MEKQVIVALILLVAGLLGVGYLIQPTTSFQEKATEVYEKEFQKFQWKYDKVYNDLNEVDKRFSIFKDNLVKIEEFNAKNHDVKVGMNQFGDLTEQEFTEQFANQKFDQSSNKKSVQKNVINRPSKVNWVGTLVWNGVYNQGSCGSCWAHSAVEALEGAYAKQVGTFVQLSIQELVDCVYPTVDTCKKGGLMDDAFKWIINEKHGICARDEYPRVYDQKQHPCEKDKCKPKLTTIESFIDVPAKDYKQTLNHLSVAPLSVAINASKFVFQFYTHGIIKGHSSSQLNHAVLMTGYDEQGGFITVKNSWGDSWGEKGYFRVALEEGAGPLGIYSMQSYPRYKGEPEPTF